MTLCHGMWNSDMANNWQRVLFIATSALIIGKISHLLQYTNVNRRHVETSKLLLGT